MRLRGGDGRDSSASNLWRTLRELVGNSGPADEPSLADIVIDSLESLPPTTRTLVVANVAIYLLARAGVLGTDPAERLGFRARDVLSNPRQHAHRLLTGAFLHLNHAHIASNMIVLASVGRQLESRLGSRQLAALIAFLVPVVGTAQLSITIICNMIASALGVRDAEHEEVRSDLWGSRQTDGGAGTLSRVLQHQVSVETISIGFSGVLFALNALAMRVLSGKSAVRCVVASAWRA
jgi:membrane associated rhomboid family serine protease